MNINKAFIYGNLTRDPELKALPSGQQVANFSVATNRTYTDKEGRKQDLTEFHNVVAFGRQAEVIAQYMSKGRPIYVEGRIQTRSWEADGKKNYRTEIIVETFQFGVMGGSSTSNSSKKAAESPASTFEYPDDEINPEDIPF